jgi:hypothetical protein
MRRPGKGTHVVPAPASPYANVRAVTTNHLQKGGSSAYSNGAVPAVGETRPGDVTEHRRFSIAGLRRAGLASRKAELAYAMRCVVGRYGLSREVDQRVDRAGVHQCMHGRGYMLALFCSVIATSTCAHMMQSNKLMSTS